MLDIAADQSADPAAPGPESTHIQRGEPSEIDVKRRALVTSWASRVRAAKGHWSGVYDKMREDMRLAKTGRTKDWPDDSYTANIIQRHINQKTATLYAKNPRCEAKRRERLESTVWDGTPEALQLAFQTIQQAAAAAAPQPAAMGHNGGPPMAPPAPVDPNALAQAQAVLQDAQKVMAHKKMMAKVGKTLEILFHYFMDEQQPSFKKQAKQLVRRTITTGVGYVQLGFQRLMEKQPAVTAQIADASQRLAVMQTAAADLAEGKIEADSAEAEELRVMLKALQAQESIVSREGLTFEFLSTTSVIPDPCTRQLNGWVGTNWLAREMLMTPEQVKDTYEIDLSTGYAEHRATSAAWAAGQPPATSTEPGAQKGMACVWVVQDKRTGLVFTICDGYPDYLKEPAPPESELERFFDIYTLTFNDSESDEGDIYPQSDVSLLAPMQSEYNRSRQGLREHRLANRPKYATVKGVLSVEDKAKLASHPANAILELEALQQGQPVDAVLQAMKTVPIDPAAYDVAPLFEDVLRTVGQQEANLGGTSGDTATEASIARESQASAAGSNVDDLDELLTELARDGGQIMLQQMSVEQVMKIVGPGAAWPEWSRQQIAEEVFLSIKAGSSGKPNKAQELANLERVSATLLQVPGISPTWFARRVLERLDDDLDLEEALIEGIPSMVAMNSMTQASTGDPASDPNAQGGRGGGNAPAAGQNEAQSQPAYPTAPVT